jgi:hypothetical protein
MFNIYQINKLKKSYDWQEPQSDKDLAFDSSISTDRPKTTSE